MRRSSETQSLRSHVTLRFICTQCNCFCANARKAASCAGRHTGLGDRWGGLPGAQAEPLGCTRALLGNRQQVMCGDVAGAVLRQLASPSLVVIPAARVEIRLQTGVPEAVSHACVRLVARDAELRVIKAERAQFGDAVGLLARVGDDVAVVQGDRARERASAGRDHGDVDRAVADARSV